LGGGKLRQEVLCKQIVEHVRLMVAKGMGPDLVFVTGDLADKGKAEQYQTFVDQFQTPLDEVLGGGAPIFTVPGNHDVDRSKAELVEPYGLLEKVHDVLDPTEGGAAKRGPLIERFRGFMEGDLSCESGWLPKPAGVFAKTLALHGCNLGILGINTAWLAKGEKGDEQKLSAGKGMLREGLGQLSKCNVKIVLGHHPVDWFMKGEVDAVRALLGQHHAIYLHGHLHKAGTSREEGAGHEFLAIQGGAAFADRENDVWVNGFIWGELNWEEKRLWVEPMKWSKNNQEWCPDGSAFPEEYRDGETNRWVYLLPGSKVVAKAPEVVVVTSAGGGSAAERRGVYGRDGEIERMAATLSQKAMVTVYGLSGIGKSRVIDEVRQTEAHGQRSYTRFRVFAGMKMLDLYRQLATALGCRDEAPKPPSQLSGVLDFAGLREFAGWSAPALIHLDSAQNLFNEEGFCEAEVGELFLEIARHFREARIILESREAPPDGLLPEDYHKAFRVEGLGTEALQAYFRRPFVARAETGWELSEAAAAEVYRRLGGVRGGKAHPFGMFLLATVAGQMKESPTDVLTRHPQVLKDELEKQLFRDLYEHVLTEAERHMLRLCALYREDIPHIHGGRLNAAVGDDHAFDRLYRRCLLTPNESEEWYSLHALIAEHTWDRIERGSEALRGDHETVAEAWLEGLKLGGRPGQQSTMGALEAAYHLMKGGRFDRLGELAGRRLQGNVVGRLDGCAKQLFERRHDPEYRRFLELWVAIDPDNHMARRFLGERIERLDGKGAEAALRQYEQAYELNREYAPYLANLGKCLLARREGKRFVEIIDGIDEGTRSRAVNDHVWAIYLNCLAQIGEREKASRLRRERIDGGSRNAVFYNDEAIWLRDRGELAEAMAVLEKAEKVGAADDYTKAIRASVMEKQGDGDGASRLRRGWIDGGSRNSAIYNDEAIWLVNEGRLAGAMEVLEKAEKAGAANEYTKAIRASVMEKLGDGDGASRLRRKWIEGGSRHAAFYADEAIWLRDKGKSAEAIEVLAKAEKAGAANEYTRNIRASIERRGEAER